MKKLIQYILLLSVALVIACNKGDNRRPDDYYVSHYDQFAKAIDDSSVVDLVKRTNIFSAKAAAGNDSIEKALALLETGDIQNYFYSNDKEAIKLYNKAIVYFESIYQVCDVLHVRYNMSCKLE